MNDVPPKPLTPSWFKRLYQTLVLTPNDRDALVHLLRQAQQRAILDREALLMVESVLQVSEMSVSEIMMPRSKMIIIEKDTPLHEILPLVIKSTHSRFPVIGDDKDDIIGVLLAKDLLIYFSQEDQKSPAPKFNIRDNLRPVFFVPESKRLNVLLNDFRKNRNHLAMVVNEYGNITGLVTIEDVLEQIVGDIEDEHDIIEAETIRQQKENQYSVQALTTINAFNEYFQTNLSDEEFDTIGGLVMQAFGHLPKRGEFVQIQGIKFTVLKANDRRIQLLKTEFLHLQQK
ncbi:MAG TPA: transporter associated domain-containing protein [Gammaproteobacteria bacterium]|nr:transporter associated domain-containing protein [Gammaproteobacteria bacterium]